MPRISYVYGIAIDMYFADHNPPHFHAHYGRSKALVAIETGEIIAGALPKTAQRLVKDWALARQTELRETWLRAQADGGLEDTRTRGSRLVFQWWTCSACER